jgi:hypothetical protein
MLSDAAPKMITAPFPDIPGPGSLLKKYCSRDIGPPAPWALPLKAHNDRTNAISKYLYLTAECVLSEYDAP